MNHHPNLPQICDLLKTGPELAVQVCLGVTSSLKEAKELFVEACVKATTIQHYAPPTGFIRYYAWRPWIQPWGDYDKNPYWLAYSIETLRNQYLSYYDQIFDQQTTTHFAQIQDLLRQGPELAVQVCLGVTSSREQARELFVAACEKACDKSSESSSIYFVASPWNWDRQGYWIGSWKLSERIRAHYAQIFDQQTQ